ncbi:MAG: OadG family transporter subunit [Brevinema sp.]
MFGNTITLVETGLITLIGLMTVFCVLILLIGVLLLFRFIPGASVVSKVSIPILASPASVVGVEDISPLHKAIVIAAILESLNTETPQHIIGIRRIQQIS